MEIPQKAKLRATTDPEIPLLGIHSDRTIAQRDTCTPMFTAALFTVVRTWKQPKYSSVEEWIEKMWYIYIGIFLNHKKE